MNTIVNRLQAGLDQLADQNTKSWWESYLKHTISFRGVNISEIKNCLSHIVRKNAVEQYHLSDKIALLNDLFNSPYAEDKIAAILFIQQYLLNEEDYYTLLQFIESVFHKNLIYDWNVCDWLCVRVLTPLINKYGNPVAQIIVSWSKSNNLWQARAAMIAFAEVSNFEENAPYIKQVAPILIKRPERFAKTAVGWTLRNFSKHDMNYVIDFLLNHKDYLTAEIWRNALKYLDKRKANPLIKKLKY